MYDWAASAFTTTVITVLIGPYLGSVASTAAADAGTEFLYPFGLSIKPASLYAYIISLSVILQVLALPLLGAIADYTHRKKQIMLSMAGLGGIATLLMFFVEGGKYELASILLIVANFSYGASIVMYNAFLNDLVPEDRRDHASSRGYAYGYLGGGVLLMINLALITFAEDLGLNQGMAVRISLASAGAWWLLFSYSPSKNLRNRRPQKEIPRGKNHITQGFATLKETFKELKHHPQAVRFLVAYLFYNDGIQTVIAMAAVFGAEEIRLDDSTLIIAILMVQIIAYFGALWFNKLSKQIGTKNAVMFSLLIWTLSVLYAFFFMADVYGFFGMAAVVAIVLGGSQALSRSLYSKYIPEDKEAEFFGFYEVSERGTSWIGTLLFGLMLQYTSSYRYAILSLIIFFVIGFSILMTLKEPGKKSEASVS